MRFSKKSLQRLSTCDKRLQALCHEVLALGKMDFSILEGYRGRKAQAEAVANGASKLRWPHSAHNQARSMAVDIAPYPIDWQEHGRFRKLASLMKTQAEKMGLSIVWGGDWGWEMPHFQVEAGELAEYWRVRLQQHIYSYTKVQNGEASASKITAASTHGRHAVQVPKELVRAIKRVESSGNMYATRFEPDFYKRYIATNQRVKTYGPCSMATERMARATSYGPMQIMGETARFLGYDKPFLSELCGPDGEEYGVRYLAWLHGKVGQYGWEAVAAAYNGGLGAVKGAGKYANPAYVEKVAMALGGVWPHGTA